MLAFRHDKQCVHNIAFSVDRAADRDYSETTPTYNCSRSYPCCGYIVVCLLLYGGSCGRRDAAVLLQGIHRMGLPRLWVSAGFSCAAPRTCICRIWLQSGNICHDSTGCALCIGRVASGALVAEAAFRKTCLVGPRIGYYRLDSAKKSAGFVISVHKYGFRCLYFRFFIYLC